MTLSTTPRRDKERGFWGRPHAGQAELREAQGGADTQGGAGAQKRCRNRSKAALPDADFQKDRQASFRQTGAHAHTAGSST